MAIHVNIARFSLFCDSELKKGSTLVDVHSHKHSAPKKDLSLDLNHFVYFVNLEVIGSNRVYKMTVS